MKLGLKGNEVKLVPYNEKWQEEFQKAKADILTHTNLAAERVEHIGSTAIKGMDAKPILDIVVGVDDISTLDSTVENQLKEVGFLRLRIERPNEIVFAKFTDDTYEEKTHYIHLVDYGKKLWNDLIFFRDYLHAHDAEREAYRQLKKDLLQQENTSRIKEYTDAKEAFVRKVYEKRKN